MKSLNKIFQTKKYKLNKTQNAVTRKLEELEDYKAEIELGTANLEDESSDPLVARIEKIKMKLLTTGQLALRLHEHQLSTSINS